MVDINIPLTDLDDKLNELKFPLDPKIYKYNPKDFEYVDIIESSRHIVKEFLYKPLNIKMAVKTIRIPQNRYEDHEKDGKLTMLKREIHSFRMLSVHPNIVDFYGLCHNDGEAMICMELMDMSLYDLYLVVHNSHEIFPEAILGYIAVQVLEALGFCKAKNFIHRDVKPKNILLNIKGEVKLCDFGESRILKDSLASTFVGTIAYWPPERFINKNEKSPIEEDIFRYDIRSDIWSLGITFTETIYGQLPFIDANGEPINSQNNRRENIVTIQHCIMNTDIDEIVKRCIGNNYSKELINFVQACLEPVEKRPKYDALMKFPFYCRYKKETSQVDMKNFIAKFREVNDIEMDDVSKNDDNVHVGTITFNENKENLLHSGSYGTQIYKGSILSIKCAVKIINMEDYNGRSPEERELRALSTLRHSNVIKCYGSHKKDNRYYIVLDLCLGSLEDFIQGKIKDRISQENWDKFQKWNRLEILKQLTDGLAHIHEQKIVHRNLRPKNVLIQTEHNGNLVAVISDFVFSKSLDLGSNYSIQSGQNNDQLTWLAPEVERDNEYTTASDIFSLGCLYYYTLTNGKFLFCTGKVDPMRIHQNIICDKKRSEGEQANDLLECKNDRYSSMDLISNMVGAKPHERRTAQNLKSHPMFWEPDHKMRFVKAVKVVLDEEKEQNSKTIENALEKVASNVFDDWIKEIQKISNIGIDLADHIRTNPYGGKHYVENSTKLTSLLRMIRNYKEHKNSFKLGDGITIFTERFPKLIIEVYKVMATFKINEELKEFYLKD